MRRVIPLFVLAILALVGCSSSDDDADLPGGWQVFACPVTNATADSQVRVDYQEVIAGGGLRQATVTLSPGETKAIQVGRYGAGAITVHITILYLGRHYEEDVPVTPAGIFVEDHRPGVPG